MLLNAISLFFRERYYIMSISTFKGKYYFLSNFYQHPVTFEGVTYMNAEAAFHAAKIEPSDAVDTKTGATRNTFATLPPNKAKALGRRVNLRPNWNHIRLTVMTEIIRSKFATEPLKSYLLATNDEELIEGNTWNDRFWGVDSRSWQGENHLGKILMQVRNELKNEKEIDVNE